MTRQTEFQTTDLDLSAAIMTATGRQPHILQVSGQPLVSFQFPNDETTMAIVISYASGDLVQPVKRFAACRTWLYRQARGRRHGA